MTVSDPLTELFERAGAQWMHYGPPPEQGGVAVAEEFGAYEAEYASIRQRVGIMHLPQRGVLDLRGADVKDFLHRLMTQDINAMAGGQSRRCFQLNEKGRVLADTFVHVGDENTWIEGDAFDLPAVAELLEARLFAEDVALTNTTAQYACFALHGPAALTLLKTLADQDVTPAAELPGTHHVFELAGCHTTVTRRDECGVMGLYLFTRAERAATLYAALLEAAGFELDAPDPTLDPQAAADAAMRRRQSLRGRPVGWLAYNTARVEAGTPLFHIDFGPDSLPAEVGQTLFDQAVSLTKGCYLGQEIVARMKNLGHPKRLLVGLNFGADELPGIPVAGSQVLPAAADGAADDAAGSQIIGGITSSTVSVLLGHKAVAFAVLKWGHHTPGTAVRVPVEGRLAEAVVSDLRFLPADSKP